ncbi:MAG: hypothetical protein KBD55_00995 [Candidatus Pacebacteria bacterium]|nr:hypothetical protein [Candidatus Paceibacterota bacterium]
MNKEETQKNIALYYSKLPKEAQEVFSRMEWLEVLSNLGLKYSLNSQQIQTLSTETTLVLLAIIDQKEYETNIAKELNLGTTTVMSILEEIKQKILISIKPQLEKAFTENTQPVSTLDEARREELDERFSKLPVDIQDAISASNYHETLYDISLKAGLNVDQMGALETITTDTMLGIISPDKFESKIKEAFDIDDIKRKDLINSINDQILKKIRGNMMNLNPETSTNPPINIYQLPKNEIKKSEEFILNKAGIKLETPEITTPKPSSESLISRMTPLPSIMEQKLSGSFQAGIVKTEHTLGNISKITNNKSKDVENTPKTYTKGDPYRLTPGE